MHRMCSGTGFLQESARHKHYQLAHTFKSIPLIFTNYQQTYNYIFKLAVNTELLMCIILCNSGSFQCEQQSVATTRLVTGHLIVCYQPVTPQFKQTSMRFLRRVKVYSFRDQNKGTKENRQSWECIAYMIGIRKAHLNGNNSQRG